MNDELAIFAPINVRSNHNILHFADLSTHVFNSIEKDFVARQCLHEFTNENPDIIGNLSGRDFKHRYNISSGTVNGWIKKYSCPALFNHGGIGRPEALDDIGKNDALIVISEGTVDGTGKKQKKRLLNSDEVTECFVQQKLQTLLRQGKRVDLEDDEASLSLNTIKRLKKVCKCACKYVCKYARFYIYLYINTHIML